MKKKKIIYTEEQLKEINESIEKGVSDPEIAKSIGVGRSAIAKMSTAYWEKKMEQKNKQNK